MKVIIKWPPYVLILVLITSCEEVIELDLGKAKPRITIEGVITTNRGPYSVKISQSIDYEEKNNFPPVSGAMVTITDQEEYSEILEEVSEGIYHAVGFQGEDGKTYMIEVDYEGEHYSASSTIPKTQVSINSISYEFLEESLFNTEGYYMAVFFSDPSEEVNYYRLKVFVNGEPYFFEVDDKLVKDDNFWLTDDKFSNGKMMYYVFPHSLKPGDQVDVELHHVDQATYDYYRTLVELMGVGGVAPANPLTNWTNGALGYFGALSVSSESIEIEE